MKNNTPGPWTVNGYISHDSIDPEVQIIFSEYHKTGNAHTETFGEAEDIGYLRKNHPDFEANAALISAAPELRRACEGFLRLIKSSSFIGDEEARDFCITFGDLVMKKATTPITEWKKENARHHN